MRKDRVKPLPTYFRTLYENWRAHRVPRLSAGLAYYTMFSLAPILVFLTAGISMVLGESDVQSRLFVKVQEVYGDRVLRIVQGLVGGVIQPGSGRLATTVSGLTFLYGSTRVFVQLQDALNTIWDIDPKSRPTIFRRLRRRSAAFAATLLAGAILLVFVIVLPSVKAFTPFIGELPAARLIWQFTDFFLTWLLVAFTFGLIYKVLPNVKLVWSDVWIGALIAALAFLAAQAFVVWYLSTSALRSVYGAAGSFIVVLFWLYISGQILMLGAEISRMFTIEHGSHAKLARAIVETPPKASS